MDSAEHILDSCIAIGKKEGTERRAKRRAEQIAPFSAAFASPLLCFSTSLFFFHSSSPSSSSSKQLSSAGAANAFSLPTALGAPFRALFGSASSGKTQKRVMILMSDTGGGHRASAEALKAGFKARYGDEFSVDSVDIWTEHTPWPFNQLPKSYGFLVKHAMLWRVRNRI